MSKKEKANKESFLPKVFLAVFAKTLPIFFTFAIAFPCLNSGAP
jgi:hypothetical protein